VSRKYTTVLIIGIFVLGIIVIGYTTVSKREILEVIRSATSTQTNSDEEEVTRIAQKYLRKSGVAGEYDLNPVRIYKAPVYGWFVHFQKKKPPAPNASCRSSIPPCLDYVSVIVSYDLQDAAFEVRE
jgi:hypothetical protein